MNRTWLCVFFMLSLRVVTLGQNPLFFDDFSTATRSPDTSRYEHATHVRISSNIGINPPSAKVAVFDALDQFGRPYTSSALSEGLADSLVSPSINLDGKTDVYLSFFWQKEGRADFPEESDSLTLYFKAPAGSWQQVWPLGETDSSTQIFTQSIVQVRDSLLHSDFQFKFVLHSRLSGAFDVWLLDYIFLNDNRSLANTRYRDRTVAEKFGQPLTPYYSVPYYHFIAGKARYLSSDSLTYQLENLERSVRPVEYAAVLTLNETLTDTLYSTFNNDDVVTFANQARVDIPSDHSRIWDQMDSSFSAATLDFTFFLKNQDTAFSRSGDTLFITEDRIGYTGGYFAPSNISSLDTPRVIPGQGILTEFSPSATEDTLFLADGYIVIEDTSLFFNDTTYYHGTAYWNNLDFPSFSEQIARVRPLAENDTLTFSVELSDYYAYDDGSAEAIYVLQGNGKVAHRFYVPEPYEMTGLDVYFPPTYQNNTNVPLDFLVLRSLSVEEDEELVRESFSVSMAGDINTFTRYEFEDPVTVEDTFYVGWEQFSGIPLAAGFDKNTNGSQGNFFFNSSGSWQTFDQQGSVMLRPVFRIIDDTVAIGELPPIEVDVWPNPASERINIRGDFTAYEILNLEGRPVISRTFNAAAETQAAVEIGHLSPGIYIIRFFDAVSGRRSFFRLIKK